MKNNTIINPKKALTLEIIIFSLWEIVRLLDSCSVYLGNYNSCMPPQSLLQPTTDIALAFAKIPLVSSFPSKSLKDKLRYSKERASRNIGI